MIASNFYQTMLYTAILATIILNTTILMVRCEEGELGPFDDSEEYCDTDCGENGECKGTGVYTPGCVPENEPETKCEVYKCACQYGWDGDGCTLQYETCNDQITTSPDENARQCFNGGTCETYIIKTDPQSEMSGEVGTRCNCQSLPTDTIAFAGHQCEFPAEQVCVKGAEHSTYAFCVNGGTCKDIVDFNEEHPLCDCLPGYGGRHCQYKLTIDGSNFEKISPMDEIEYVNLIMHGQYGNETKALKPYSSKSNDDELSGGMKFFIILIVFILCSITCCICIRRRRRNNQSTARKTGTSSSSTSINKGSDLTPDSAWDTRDEDIPEASKAEII
jgi:hypothetical protein